MPTHSVPVPHLLDFNMFFSNLQIWKRTTREKALGTRLEKGTPKVARIAFNIGNGINKLKKEKWLYSF